MKWKLPKVNQERKVSGFLLFPLKLGTEARWLEKANWIEVYKWDWNLGKSTWQPDRWDNDE